MLTLVKIVIGILAVTCDRGFLESGAGRWLGTSNKPSHGLQCYTDVAATEITVCKENEGFRTCFTKYNDSKFRPPAKGKGEVQEYDEGQVTGRGCSTKDKVFYKECETHSYGDQVEKMCFCSFFLCNAAASPSRIPNLALTILSAAAAIAITATQWDHILGFSEDSFPSSSKERKKRPSNNCDNKISCCVSDHKTEYSPTIKHTNLPRTLHNIEFSLNCSA